MKSTWGLALALCLATAQPVSAAERTQRDPAANRPCIGLCVLALALGGGTYLAGQQWASAMSQFSATSNEVFAAGRMHGRGESGAVEFGQAGEKRVKAIANAAISEQTTAVHTAAIWAAIGALLTVGTAGATVAAVTRMVDRKTAGRASRAQRSRAHRRPRQRRRN